MKIVLDTHIVVHAARDELDPERKVLLEDASNALFVSAVTLWEITKLVELGRLEMPDGPGPFLSALCDHPRFAIHQYDAALMMELLAVAPKFRGDPADQIIVATTRSLSASLVTKDSRLRDYPHIRTAW